MKLFQIKQEIVMINIQFTFQQSNEIPSYTPLLTYSDLRAKRVVLISCFKRYEKKHYMIR